VTSRALSVLECFDTAHPRLTLSDISRRAGLPLATAHRLVGELESWCALSRDEEGTYEIGARLWNLGLLAPVHTELRELAAPLLMDVYDATRDNVHLAVRDGSSALYVEKVAGRRSVPVVSRNGGRLPLHATGVGKALLAHAPRHVLACVLQDLRRITPRTITDPVRMREELALVRARGWAATTDEMTVGTSSVAVPVRAADGGVIASIGIVSPGSRTNLDGFVPLLLATARTLSRQLPRSVRSEEPRYVTALDAG